MSKIVEAMRKQAEGEGSDKGAPLVVLDPPAADTGITLESIRAKHAPLSPSTEPSRERPREGGYTKLEVKKMELEEALKSLDSAIREQETKYKVEIKALNVKRFRDWTVESQLTTAAVHLWKTRSSGETKVRLINCILIARRRKMSQLVVIPCQGILLLCEGVEPSVDQDSHIDSTLGEENG
ncbi:hypothetical protein JCGZ_16669 [Jatropha curcas]|uniref:Uncharacterized protein n=1 Tax=Jatropha curcas TaxID=180498 RepID=A0A067KDU6_JATCU|nr:hypothetical protein JCGZ_16669 [Jatropha curcas]